MKNKALRRLAELQDSIKFLKGGKFMSNHKRKAKARARVEASGTRVALYLRVSTDKQETENQAIVLREFATKQGWGIVREYCDYESGA